jgi:uncharacterized radical SAM superfamily Fe-S cluster-containing enzyme
MMTDEAQAISTTESVCPDCLARIPAQHVLRGDDVYLRKTCPEHGDFETIVWRGGPAYVDWARPKIPAHPAKPLTAVDQGCPFDCGLCPDHRQQTCTAVLEVTQQCDLRCPFCFANAGSRRSSDPAIKAIEGWYRRLLDTGGPVNVQLSGGEPTLRNDLPDIIALGKSLGFSFIQVNSNGVRLARDAAYVQQLKQAGLSSVFLQFDGTNDGIMKATRGVRLLDRKRAAIERCAENELGVVLVPTLVPGVNTDDIGGIIDFALEYFPAVRGVHFQPVAYFGRYPKKPADADRYTIPDVVRAVEAQSGGKIKAESFTTSGCENALCSLHGNFVVMPDGALRPWTQHKTASCCTPQPADIGAEKTRQFVAEHWSAGADSVSIDDIGEGNFREWEVFLARTRTHTFCISGMAFQDAWNLDLERLKDCCIHTVSPDGRIIPFCAYNLTSRSGRALYRGQKPAAPAHV